MDISIKDAAERLGKSQRTVRHMAQTGRIPARRIGSRWLIKTADIEALKAGRVPTGNGNGELLTDADYGTETHKNTTEQAARHASPPPSAESAPPAAAPRSNFTVSFANSLNPTPRKLDHTISEVRDLDVFTVTAGILAEVAFLRHDGPCDQALIDEIERSLRGILQVLADGLQQNELAEKIERFRQAQTRACGALTGMLHYNMVYAEPDLAPIATRVEHDLLPGLRELIELLQKRARLRGRAISAAEHALQRVFTQARTIAGEGPLSDSMHTLHETLSRALVAAL